MIRHQVLTRHRQFLDTGLLQTILTLEMLRHAHDFQTRYLCPSPPNSRSEFRLGLHNSESSMGQMINKDLPRAAKVYFISM